METNHLILLITVIAILALVRVFIPTMLKRNPQAPADERTLTGQSTDQLLPEEAYRAGLGANDNPQARANIDRKLRELQPLLPTEPGRYEDVQGHIWTLHASGIWEDRHSVTKPTTWTPMMALGLPLTPVTEEENTHEP